MRMESLPARRIAIFLVVLLLGMVLTACGADDEDGEPTATSAPEGAQPTVAVEEPGTPASSPGIAPGSGSPTNTDMSDVPASMTPDDHASPDVTVVTATPAADATPAGSASGLATTVASPAVDSTRPVTPVAGDDVEAASTPAPAGSGDTTTEGDATVGDGTTGAAVVATPGATPAIPSASPGASPVAGTPAAVVTVSGCEVADVPPFAGEQTTFVLTSDVNFRVGPGADCALALETPLGEFQQVDVIGGPVVREDDGSEWVQIRVLDTEGWVAFEFLRPSE